MFKSFHLNTIIICHVFCFLYLTVLDAHLLSSTEQLVGTWEVTIVKKHKSLFDTILFPDVDVSNNDQQEHECDRGTIITRVIKKTLGNKDDSSIVKCILSIEDGGTFSLSPLKSNVNRNTLHQGSCLSVHGNWLLGSACYCVTDRHYDDLSLISYPRVRIWKRKAIQPNLKTVYSGTYPTLKSTDPTNPRTPFKVAERARVEFRCKVWGRYGSQVVRQLMGYGQNRERSRMTHGSILAVRSGPNFILSSKKWQWWKRRVVLGNFSAKAIPSQWEEEYERRQQEDMHGVLGTWLYRRGRWSFVEENQQ